MVGNYKLIPLLRRTKSSGILKMKSNYDTIIFELQNGLGALV